MNSTSYVFSFVLGLIVVVVFLVVLNSRFHFASNLFNSANGNKIAIITPTPEPSTTPVPTVTKAAQKKPTSAPARKPTSKPVVAQTKLTMTPQPVARRPSPTMAPVISKNTMNSTGQVKGVSQIPNTGSPTELLPILAAGIFAGFKLRKASA